MTPSRIGLLVSLALHAGVALLVLWWWYEPTPAPAKGEVVPLNLAMFEAPRPPVASEPKSAPVAKPTPPEPPVTPVTPPESPPEPPVEATPAEPEPSPVAEAPHKTLQEPPKPAPPVRKVAKPQPKPTPKPKSEPKPETKPAKPKPVPRPKPKTLPPAEHPASEKAASAPSREPEKSSAVPPATAPDTAQLVQIQLQYQAALSDAINRQKFYPRLARRLRQEGIVTVAFTVLANGQITQVRVVGSSGMPLLDQGAVEAIDRVRRFRPIPSALGLSRMPVQISLNYNLR